MAGPKGRRLEELLEQYMAEVQTLLGNDYCYATATGTVQEKEQNAAECVEIVVYVSGKAGNVLVENALEAMRLEYCRNYGISLSVSLRKTDEISS